MPANRIIKLAGKLGPITFLRAELTGDDRSSLAIVSYSLEGKRQVNGLRLDINKRAFLDVTGISDVDNLLPTVASQIIAAFSEQSTIKLNVSPGRLTQTQQQESERLLVLPSPTQVSKPRLFADFDSKILGRLSADEAIQLFRSLLWCSARRYSIPIHSITITANVNTPDGGIDADVAPNTISVDEDVLIAGNSFFQIKAGVSATPWQKGWLRNELIDGKKPLGRKFLGEAVRHCLDRNGRYVIVCFGCDPTGAQRRKAIAILRDLFQSCGYSDPRVDVWGQGTLAGLFHPFPSIALTLSDRKQLPFLTYSDWKLDAEMRKPLHLGKEQQQTIEQIQTFLRGSTIRHVRLVGEPGLGKTRLVMEAVSTEDLSPAVIYVRHPEDFQQGPLFNSILRSDDVASMILIIDDCPERERASIWNALRERSDRIRLITLDHGPDNSSDELMRVIQCPLLEKEQIQAILAEYIGRSSDNDHWAGFCTGSPRVAHAVGENLKRNPTDILKPPASVPLWERFVRGNSRAGSQDELHKEVVLRHIALFHKFGFEHPVDAEARFISSLVEQADPSITWSKFQSIVKHFRQRRILQGKTTLFIVPKLLHIYFWAQFWEHYGHGTDITDLISRMPQSLFRWFTEMFKYGHASENCLSRIEIITSPGGPFDNRELLISGQGTIFLNELAEAHPSAVLHCLERTIGKWPREELLELAETRQYLVWALEKIAIWKDLFQRAARVLLKLALAENAKYSNNATGIFCELFTMGWGRMASSEAPPQMRLPVLEDALNSHDSATRMMGLKAIACNLADQPHSKIVGPEFQGMRELPKLWTPKKYGEIFSAYRSCWNLIDSFRERSAETEKAAATKVMIDAAFWLLQNRWIENDILITIEKIALDPQTDLRLLVEFISRYRVLNWHSLSRKASKALRDIDNRILGATIKSQITRMVLLGNHDDIQRGDSDPYGKNYIRKLAKLAKSALAEPDVLISLLPEFFARDNFALISFGRAWGEEDSSFQWWPTLWTAFIEAGDQRKPELAMGYLGAMFQKSREVWEAVALQILEDKILLLYSAHLVLGSGMTETVLRQLCGKIEQGILPAEAINRIGYVGKAYDLSTDQLLHFIDWCAAQGTSELANVGLTTAYVLYCMDKDAPTLPEHPLLSLLTASHVLKTRKQQSSDYQWSELTKKYIEAYPQHSVRVLESVLSHFDNFEFVLGLSHSQAQTAILNLIRRDPKAAWATISDRFGPLNGRTAHNYVTWLRPGYSFGERSNQGLLSLFDTKDVLLWIDQGRDERAPYIARVCPKTFAQPEGRLTREMLIRYGDLVEVKSALWSNFGTESWSGKASDHYRNRRDQMRGWLSSETARPVIEWLEEYIDYLGTQIKNNEIQEEREF